MREESVSPVPDERRLRLYLLGSLTEPEAEELEALCFQEGSAFDELVLAEDDLIDDYAGDRLAPDERRAFEAVFLSSPVRRERLEFARALRRAASAIEDRPARRGGSVALLAAAVAVCLAGTAFVALRLRAATEAQLEASQERLRALQDEATGLRASAARLAEELAAAARPAAGVVTWIPAPGITRSTSSTRALVLEPGTEWVRLRLPVERSTSVAVEVQTPEGRVAWTQPALSVRPPAIDAMVPARTLAPGTYLVLLKTSGGAELASFPLRIVAP
jgi:hypothetical protein